MNIEDVKKFFNFKDYSYFYHITGDGIEDIVCEEGLLADGTNILDEELHEDSFRGTSEMVILGCNKSNVSDIVYLEEQEKDGKKYERIVFPNHIMGYFNIDKEFTPNELFDYGSNFFYEEHESFSK